MDEYRGLLPASDLRPGDQIQYWGQVVGLHVYPDRVEFARSGFDDAQWVVLAPDMEIWVSRSS